MPRFPRLLTEGGIYHVYNRFARGDDMRRPAQGGAQRPPLVVLHPAPLLGLKMVEQPQVVAGHDRRDRKQPGRKVIRRVKDIRSRPARRTGQKQLIAGHPFQIPEE